MSARLAILCALCAPLPSSPPGNRFLWRRVWLPLVTARYRTAEREYGYEGARRFDFIPF